MATATGGTYAGDTDDTGSASDALNVSPSSVCGGDQVDNTSRVSPSEAIYDAHASHACTCSPIAASSSALPSL